MVFSASVSHTGRKRGESIGRRVNGPSRSHSILVDIDVASESSVGQGGWGSNSILYGAARVIERPLPVPRIPCAT
jgi:hypothetical protein